MSLSSLPVSSPVSLGHQLFGGLFGETGGAGTGLFSLALALFAQSGLGVQTAAGGPTATTPTASTGTILPSLFILPENSADPAQPVDWAALLQSLAGDQPLSADLKKLLGDQPLTLGELQDRLDTLDSDSQQALLAEIASLLAPVVAQLQPVVPAPANEDDAVSLDGKSSRAAVDTQAPKQDGEAKTGDNTSPDDPISQLTRLLQKNDSRTGQSAPETTVATPAAQETAATAPSVLHKDKDFSRTDSPAPAAAANANTPQQIHPVGHSQNGAAPRPDAIATVGERTTNTTGNTPGNTSGNTSGGDAGTGHKDSAAGNASGDTAASASLAATPARDTGAASFAAQLAKVNSTGAYAPVSEQVAVHLTRALQDGKDHVTIRLHPAELGRIEVRLDMGTDGRISAHFSVDQPATLDLLQRDQRGLERALGDAGFKPDNSSLSFNLRGDGQQQGQQQAQNGSGQGGQAGQSGFNLSNDPVEETPAGQIEMTWFVNPDRLDVRV